MISVNYKPFTISSTRYVNFTPKRQKKNEHSFSVPHGPYIIFAGRWDTILVSLLHAVLMFIQNLLVRYDAI